MLDRSPLDSSSLRQGAHEAGNRNAGISMDGDVANMMDLNVIDPLKVKTNAIESASRNDNNDPQNR